MHCSIINLVVRRAKRSLVMGLFAGTLTLTVLSAGKVHCQEPVMFPPGHDYELADIRSIIQDFGAVEPFQLGNAPDGLCAKRLADEYLDNLYAPWFSDNPLLDVSRAVTAMVAFGQRGWYGENLRHVPPVTLAAYLENSELSSFPALRKRAVALVPTAVRELPTDRPLFRSPDGFPFDALQNTLLKTGEPVQVLHRSGDGIWLFIATADCWGWVAARDMVFVDDEFVHRWRSLPRIVVIVDQLPVHGFEGVESHRLVLGTILPLLAEDDTTFTVQLAGRASGDRAITRVVRLPKMSAVRFPLEMTAATVRQMGNQLLGKPYGWGELHQNRDCSALLRDFFIPFGIWLPRGSSNQIHAGQRVELTKLSDADKEQAIRAFAVPYLTLIYLRGHIMLYVGMKDGRPIVFHALWGVSVPGDNGVPMKQVVGKAVLTTLTPGNEFRLTYGTLLHMVRSMRVVSESCAAGKPVKELSP